ncbi:LysM peptidoglycan-binding domain-containing protein [Propioniciclava sp. MC1683]|nr:LysM peptidoglycan-binding domain-containing protein [Propioniciclava sp. MC1683]
MGTRRTAAAILPHQGVTPQSFRSGPPRRVPQPRPLWQGGPARPATPTAAGPHRKDTVGLFDSIKDALTTDDAERYGKAEKRLAEAEADAKAKADAEAAAAAQAKADADAAAAQAAEAEQLAATTLREYTVVKGDTLSAIGKRFGVKWRDIAELNDIKNPDLIFPGQVFKIPNA